MIRRFFRSFFWALLLGTVLTWLYLGWVSASSREAVIIEDRYEGILDEPVYPGTSRFVPARAVPGRVTLHRVYLGPRILKWTYKHGLAQSEALGLDDTFYIKLDLRLEYKLDPARLSTLLLELDRPDFRRLSAYLRFRLRLVADRFLKTKYTRDADIPNLESELQVWLREGEALSAFNRELADSGIEVRRVIPVKVYVPDRNRYAAMLNLGERALLALKLERIRRINEARIERDTKRIKDRAYFAHLDEMGRLLLRYPELREYVTMELVGDRVRVLVLPRERFLDSGKSLQGRIKTRFSRNAIERLLEDLQGEENPSSSALSEDEPQSAARAQFRTEGSRVSSARPLASTRARFRDLTPP